MELLSQTAYARHRGCDHRTVGHAIRNGRIRTVDGLIDVAESDQRWSAWEIANGRSAPIKAWMTQAQYSVHRGVSQSHVAYAVKTRRISLIDGQWIDPRHADNAWALWESLHKGPDAAPRRIKAMLRAFGKPKPISDTKLLSIAEALLSFDFLSPETAV